jgi:O-antigen/teichoic acid export membrane protein
LTTPQQRLAVHQRLGRNGVATLTGQALRFLLFFGTTVVLARKLSPADFGLFAIAFAFTGFLEIAKDGGLVVPVVQSDTIDASQLTSLFWVNAATGIVLTVLSAALAPFAAHFYHEPRLSSAVPILALTFLAGGLSTQHRALLRRHARFTALAICETTALAVACAVSVLSALHGAGYWSLIWLYVTWESLLTLFTFPISGWLPGRPSRATNIRSLLRFGGMMMAFDLLGYLNLKFDNLVVGWYLGPASLGFYERAYQLLLLPLNQIAFPVSGIAHTELSRARHDPAHYREIFDRLLLVTTALGMPLTAFLFANTPTIVPLVLGPQWLPSVPIFRALAPAAILMTITVCLGWIFLSLARAARQLRWGVLNSAVTVAGFFIGVHWGAVGVAAAVSTTRVVLFVPALIYTCSGSPIEWTRIIRISLRPAFASLVALSASLTADAVAGDGPWSLPRNVILFAAAYLAAWFLVPGGKAALLKVLQREGFSKC